MPGGVFTSSTKFKRFQQSRGADIPKEVLIEDVEIGFCGSDVFNEGLLSGEYRPLGFNAVASAGCELVLAKESARVDKREPLTLATSYPLSALYYCAKAGYEVEKVEQFGGGIEGKLKDGNYNAIFDIKETGDTLSANDLEVVISFGEVVTGLVFRKEEYDPEDYVLDAWRLRAMMQTVTARYVDVVRGKKPDRNRKNTSLMLADENVLVKVLGEENAELIRAIIRNEDVADETADNLFAMIVANVKSSVLPAKAFNALFARNKKPTLRLE